MHFASLIPLSALIGTALAGQYKSNLAVDGPNPTRVTFNLYEPTNVKPNAPVVVGLHWCGGNAQQAHQTYGFAKYADQYGFVVIYPQSTVSCWDMNTVNAIKHNAGGDSLGVVSMVKQVIKQYNADPSRVFATGFSAGAMMTNTLLGAYPDVFAAGSANSGVAFGCCSSATAKAGACDDCSKYSNYNAQQWAQLVKDAYPGYNGWRPKALLFHGANDNLFNNHEMEDEVKQWATIHGISTTPVKTEMNTPNQGWTHTVYGNGEVEAYKVANMGHDSFSYRTDLVYKFFDLTCPAGDVKCFRRGDSPAPNPTTASPTTPAPTSSGPSPTTTQPVTTPTTTAPSGSGVALWGQCGGQTYKGPTTCAQGKCVKLNDYYSQCQ